MSSLFGQGFNTLTQCVVPRTGEPQLSFRRTTTHLFRFYCLVCQGLSLIQFQTRERKLCVVGNLSISPLSTPRNLWRLMLRGLSLLLLSGLLIPSITLADPPHLPDEYFNTFDEAKAACAGKVLWYEANYGGYYNAYVCEQNSYGPNTAKWAVWDFLFSGTTLTDLYRAIFPVTPCPAGQNYVAPGVCTIPPPEATKNNGCSADAMRGDPCNAATGNEYYTEVDLTSVDGTIPIIRYYNSSLMIDLGFGAGWTSSIFGNRLYIHSNTVQLVRTDGRGEAFTCNGSTCQGDAETRITLSQDVNGYTLTTKDGAIERYNTAGKLLTETDRNGRTTSYGYDTSGRLSTVTGPFGHGLTLTYNSSSNSNHVSQISGGIQTPTYTYDAKNNLTKANFYPGMGTTYQYENTSFPNNLTGISYYYGSTNFRYATIAYDSTGKVVSTQHAAGVEQTTFSYDSPTQTTVTDAANTQEVMTFTSNLGAKALVAKVNQGDGKNVAQTFDANNNLTCKKDEEGRVTTYTYNGTNQKVSMTEGLTGTCDTPVTTSATRTITYSYLSPTLDLLTVIQSPSVYSGQSKTTTITYGDAAHPTLPTTITQSGFTPAGTPVSRSVGLTYNSTGQVISIDGPRTDVNDITTLAYYDCTTGGACGQLRSLTNALGQVTTFDTYEAHGKLTQMTDPNGLRTNYVYTLGLDYLARVTTLTQTPPTGTARTTQYWYNQAGGDLVAVSLPDGTKFNYSYNAARQLSRVTDNGGNYVTYSYDGKGNRISEYTYNPTNVMARQLDLTYDIRNHVSSINAAGSLTQQINDAVGNLTQQINPNNNPPTTNSFDALNRLVQTLNSLSGTTSYAYNPNGRLQQVVAPNNTTTQYQYDDLGNLLQETSADRGTTAYTYDNAGNVTSISDARGVMATYAYDALNRVTSIDYPGTAEDVTYAYDNCALGIGRLCQVADASGTTQYGYDAFGNVLTENKTELGVVYTTSYTYDAANRIKTITYPDNRLVTYTRDSLGRITTVSATVSGTAKTLVSARTYRADNLLLTQSYGNGLSESRTYDLQGRLTNQNLGTADTRIYGYDPNGNVTSRQNLSQTASYGYDALDRLIQDSITSTPSSGTSFSYDPNGNRQSDSGGSYIYLSTTNRLSQNYGHPITLDAAGNTANDGTYNYVYNNAGELQSVAQGGTLGSYVYNHRHQRTQKTTASSTTVYHYDVLGNLILETNASGVSQVAYVWADDQPQAQIVKSGSTDALSYLLADQEGTPRLATSTTKAVVWRYEGRAFGNTAPTGSVTLNLRFPDMYADSETGLYYNNARYYDPKIGRYISSDPIGLDGGLNTYAYTYNNPLRYTDPSGLCPICFAIPWAPELGGLLTTIGTGVAVGLGASAPSTPSTTDGPIQSQSGEGDNSRSRGKGDPVGGYQPFNPGKDCNGKCKPCPPPDIWQAPGDAHGSTGGSHWHGIVWDQTADCMCYPKRVSGPSPDKLK